MPPILPTHTEDFSVACTPQRPTAPAAVGRSATANVLVLGLQRSHGNQAVARSVSQRVARQPATDAPPAPAGRSWAEQTTVENKPLGTEIDTLAKLTDDALANEREIVAVRASRYDRNHDEDVLELEAIEFLAAQRGLSPLKYRDETYNHEGDGVARRNVRWLLEAGIRETGSLSKAEDRIDHQSSSVKTNIDAIRLEADAFGKQFEIQARGFALLMLARGEDEILRTLASYGLDRDWAKRGASDLLDDKDVDDVAEMLVSITDPWEADSYQDEDGKPRPARFKRVALAHEVGLLNAQQQAVVQARKPMAALVKHDAQRGDYIPDSDMSAYKAARERYEAAERRLSIIWARAERRHPVLASFRTAKPFLHEVDLGDLEQVGGVEGSKPQMKTMLRTLLPKLRDIRVMRDRLHKGYLKPLALPPVVALTKAAMFVPEGSIRAGKVNDLVEHSERKSVSTYIAEGLLALIVIATLIPSGGATLGIAIGLAGAALSATSAVEDWEDYQQKKMLSNTALDRAKALSTEEPSLLPFAVDLISLGLDGLPLIKAFHGITELNKLVRAGDEIEQAKELERLRRELDAIGAGRGKPHLGEDVLDDLQNTKRSAHPKPPPVRLRKPPGSQYETVVEVRAAIRKDLAKLDVGTPNAELKAK